MTGPMASTWGTDRLILVLGLILAVIGWGALVGSFYVVWFHPEYLHP